MDTDPRLQAPEAVVGGVIRVPPALQEQVDDQQAALDRLAEQLDAL